MSEQARRAALIAATVVLVAAVGIAVWASPLGAGGADADRERVDRLLARPVTDVDGVLGDAATIADPVLRQVAVEEWIHRNVAALDPAAGSRVCQSLGGVAMDVCLRKVNSPHLRRGAAP